MDTHMSGGGGAKEDDKEVPFVPEKGFYQPPTDVSWEAYQALLCVVEQQLGGFPRLVLCGAADEVLSVLKSQNFNNPMEKKAEIEKLLKPITHDTFDQLVLIGTHITDYYQDHHGDSSSDGNGFYFYQPGTEESQSAYQFLLSIVEQQVGVQPQIVQCFAADEVLSILKNENIKSLDIKREAIERVLNPISDTNFDLLMFIEGAIKDHPNDHRDRDDVLKGPGPGQGPAVANNEVMDCDQSPISWWGQDEEEDEEVNDDDQIVIDDDNDDECKKATADDIEKGMEEEEKKDHDDQVKEEMDHDRVPEDEQENDDWVLVDDALSDEFDDDLVEMQEEMQAVRIV